MDGWTMKMSVFSKTCELNRNIHSYASRITDVWHGAGTILPARMSWAKTLCTALQLAVSSCLRDAHGDGQGEN